MADGTSWFKPSLSLRARPISAWLAPFHPGQNLNTSAIPAPPSLIPQPSSPYLYFCSTRSALPLYLLLLFSACLALSFPGHFIRDGGGNQQSSHPIPNTNITSSFFPRRCPTLATRSSHLSFSFLAHSNHSFVAAPSLLQSHRACPICATVVRKTRSLRASYL